MVQTGCCTRAFDTSFPLALQGRMNPEIWSQNVAELNNMLNSALRPATLMSVVMPLLFIAFFAAGVLLIFTASFGFFFILFALIFVGFIVFAITLNCVRQAAYARVQRWVADKNASVFLPLGLQWHFRSISYRTGYNWNTNSSNTVTQSWIEIEIMQNAVVIPVQPGFNPQMGGVVSYSPTQPQMQPQMALSQPQMDYPPPNYAQATNPQVVVVSGQTNGYCPRCSSPMVVGDDFCRKCGASRFG